MHTLHLGDCLDVLRTLPDASAQTCVTSPPYYGLRDYGQAGQIGLEQTPDAYVARLVEVFREVRRVLRDDGTLWLNLGDSYSSSPPGIKSGGVSQKSTLAGIGSAAYRDTLENSVGQKRDTSRLQAFGIKPKDLIGIPWMVAFALRADGWYLRQDIIWHKPNPMPESVKDRCTKAHEYLFLLSKSPRYYFDAAAIAEPAADVGGGACFGKQAHDAEGTGAQQRTYARPKYKTRNRRSVWTITPKPFKGAHFATFPPALVEPCILAGSPVGGVVLDPFAGAGTTGLVAVQHGRDFVGIELNPEYLEMARQRIEAATNPET